MLNIQRVFVNLEIMKKILVDKLRNERIARKTVHDIHLKSMYIVTSDNLTYLDCFETIEYLRRGIHLNLFFNEQVNNWLEKCESLDVD